MKRAANCKAWALGQQRSNGFHVRKVCWGLMMAQAERRLEEEIRAAAILVEKQFKKRRSVAPELWS